MEYTARLEKWYVFGQALYGRIYDDKKGRWVDGHDIKVSAFDEPKSGLKEGMIVETKNSSYLLGKSI